MIFITGSIFTIIILGLIIKAIRMEPEVEVAKDQDGNEYIKN